MAHALTLQVEVLPTDELQLELTDAAPGASVSFLGSAVGPGAGSCPAALGGGCLGVVGPLQRVTRTADATGRARAVVAPPSGASASWWQAVAGAELSSVVEVSLVPVVEDLACVAHPDNVLRVDCTVTLDRPARAEVTARGGGVERRVRGDAVAATHVLTLVGLPASTPFDVRARGRGGAAVAGTFTTGALPAHVDLDLAVTGSTDAGPFLFNTGCGATDALIVADGAGRVLWYQDVAALDPSAVVTRGFGLTPHGTLLVLVDRFAVAELGFDGEVAWRTDTPDPLHHEVLWWGDKVLAVDARALGYPNGLDYVLDGVRWFDGADGAELATWSADEVIDPQGLSSKVTSYWAPLFPGAIDWAHTNAVAMTDDGGGILSLKAMNALQKVVLDPDAPDFGALRWTLTGKASSPLATDLARISSTGVTPMTFGDQHHVTTLPGGDLLLFDNVPGPGQPSRVLRMTIDEVAGVADIVQAWPLGRTCPAQGSAVWQPDGSVIADCAALDTLVQIAADGSEPWSMEVSCANGANPPRPLYRALVVEGW